MRSPSKGLPVYGSQSPPIGPVLSISRSRTGYSNISSKLHKRPAGARLLRFIAAGCVASLLFMAVYMQTNLAEGAVDRMDRTPGNTAAHAVPVNAAAHKAEAADTATPAVVQAVAPAGGYPAPHLQHLVLVAGHAVYTGVDYHLATKESSWFLEPYQQIPGQAQTFLNHIKLGIETAAADPNALLLFSGGQTRQAAGPRSEGLSYWLVAEAAGWYGHTDVRSRAFTEEHARDSFENVLFSLCRFFELTGHYPAKVTAVSYSLKQQRFEQVHRAAVRYPAANFNFLGTPVPERATGAAAGEAATVAAFKKDPYGCSGSLLAKKARRDPFAVGAPHPTRCPDMAGLLNFCSPKLFTGSLPWDRDHHSKGSGGLVAGRHSSRTGIYT